MTPSQTVTPTPTATGTPTAAQTADPPPTSAPLPAPTATPRPASRNTGTEKVFHDYFDIASGSGPGSEVIGRINLERNRNVAASPITGDYTFAIIEDDSGGMFDLRAERDTDGRLFGVFSVAEGQTAQTGAYSLRVELRQGPTVTARFTAPVSVAPRTQWDIYYDKAIDFVSKHGRLTGRQNYRDAEVAALIAGTLELEANDGTFEGMRFYNATTSAAWQAVGANELGKELQEAANRIGGLGQAYAESRKYGR